MRPVRLELHGFTAFREETVIDFADADLFALAGPTGAGKSSIIDGMCFALYGSVPRLDRRTVAPVVSTGKVEARIRFDFTIGERAFTAVRVVRRTATGATTKEARLEHDGQTLAGDADGMTAAVERLLGLGFDQFTKCVVLPQGDFARFLHDKPAARQELLVKLLELGVYERMRAEANTRRVAAEASVELTERQLEGLSDATPEALQVAADHVERLAGLRAEIDDAQPHLDAAAAAGREAAQVAADATAAAASLRDVTVPQGVTQLAAAVAAAEEAVTTAARNADAAQSNVAAAEQARAEAGDPAVLVAVHAAHDQREVYRERIAKGQEVVADRRAAEQDRESARDTAAAEAVQATGALEAARREHAAHALAATLAAGEPCPVCQQAVTAVPQRQTPAALDVAESRHAAAAKALRDAEAALVPARNDRAKAEHLLESLAEQLAEVERQLSNAPSAQEVTRRLAEISAADEVLAKARAEVVTATAALRDAQAAAEQARAHRDEAWTVFDRTRDSVAALGPPPVERADLAAAWAALAQWATAEVTASVERATQARARAAQAAADAEAIAAKITTRCDDCGVALAAGARARDAVADAFAAAEAEQRRITAAIAQAEQLRGQLERHRDDAAVAKSLGQHLSARGFEQWLLDEALGRLAEGASEILRELSAGQYSLNLDAQRNFGVVDHRNADEQRPARTLSGGETFLASLALALSLADHLLQLSVATEPRLESIFLDEGFGSLDAETLDVVAAAIEELGARGRTVGLVTHVRDLAERMPLRFEVRKGPGGSSVERIEA
jgi:DNA repair protein SbcC/Rad50